MPRIDATPRLCGCGETFSLATYPPGAFTYKYQVQANSHANVCPSCEADILENTLTLAQNSTIKPATRAQQRKHGEFIRQLEEDIRLLRTEVVETPRHAKNVLRVYGEYLTHEQERHFRAIASSE